MSLWIHFHNILFLLDFIEISGNKYFNSRGECNNNYLSNNLLQLSTFSAINSAANCPNEQPQQFKPTPKPKKKRQMQIDADRPHVGKGLLPHRTVALPTAYGKPNDYQLVCKLPTSPEGRAYTSAEYEFITFNSPPGQ